MPRAPSLSQPPQSVDLANARSTAAGMSVTSTACAAQVLAHGNLSSACSPCERYSTDLYAVLPQPLYHFNAAAACCIAGYELLVPVATCTAKVL
eukprot:3672-Heterococcus_DN1.PRE.8